MKNLLKIFSTLALLTTFTATSGQQENDFPEEIMSEDIELNRDNLESMIAEKHLLLVFFFDRQDSRMEKTTSNIRKAVTNLRNSGLEVEFGTFEAPITPRIEKTYHVYKFPKLLVFLGGKRYPMSAPPYPRQIEAFVKRLVREQDKTISYKLKDKDMFGKLIDREGTLVVYCGASRKDAEFDVFEAVARDAKQIYVYCFDQKICRWIHLRHMGLEHK